MAAEKSPPASCYVDWEEVSVSNDKGRREVQYFLKRSDGGSDLAVVGKEKSLRHMSYHFAIRNRAVHVSSAVKLKSRREVVDWLTSIVSGGTYKDGNAAEELDIKNFRLQEAPLQKPGHHTKEFIWVGSPWTCRKRRRHYHSFRRNGVRISVHDFTYVLAEEDKRLVAYLDDMYEDSRGNKMVVVRWFHKIDEVGSVLPRNFSDREVYFSLCLQDLSIECIDGLATVLSPQHFEKFQNEGRHTLLDPFVCCKQFENDEAKPFDITHVKGYWKQEILRYMNISPPKSSSSPQTSDSLRLERTSNDMDIPRPRKRLCVSRYDGNLQCTNNKESIDALCLEVPQLNVSSIDCKIGTEVRNPVGEPTGNEAVKQNSPLTVGSQIEVLSQDSGMKGCWFRALIIKKRKDRVKVQYQDIQDADDETKKLEEWIVASKVAVPDQCGMRLHGRSIVRPPPQTNKGRVSWVAGVGSAVDVWWHDGWWEGIVVRKESENKLHIHFPGEKKESIFELGDLRLSQEWVGNIWRYIKDRPDIATSILAGLENDEVTVKSKDLKLVQAELSQSQFPLPLVGDGCQAMEVEATCSPPHLDSITYIGRESIQDLSKDNSLSELKWSLRKRRRVRRRFDKKLQKFDNAKNLAVGNDASTTEVLGSQAFEEFFISTSIKLQPFKKVGIVLSKQQELFIDPFQHQFAPLSETWDHFYIVFWLMREVDQSDVELDFKKLPETSLAALESLSLPLVQEVVLSAEIHCADCQKRLADMMAKMKETESVIVNVREKKVTLICRYPTTSKEPSNPIGKVELIRRMF